MEVYTVPSSDEEELAFQRICDQWADSLISRHDSDGLLVRLPFDPEKYPFQKMDGVFVEAYEPSWEEMMNEGGRIGVQARVLNEIKEDCQNLIGSDNYDRLVSEMINQGTGNESAIRIVLGRMNVPRQDVAVVTLHGKIMSMPVLQAARAQAMASSSYVRSPRFKGGQKTFDLFNFTKQNYTFVNSAVTKMGLRNPEPGGEPVSVIDRLSQLGNVVILVPPTTSSTAMGISKDTRKKINAEAMEAFATSITNLHNQNRSGLLTIDPTASTAEHIYGPDGVLQSLQHKRINPLAAGMIQQNFKYALPEILWWDKDPREASWYLGDPVIMTEVGSTGTAQKNFSGMMASLAAAEGRLSGAEVLVGGAAIGKVAVGEALQAV